MALPDALERRGIVQRVLRRPESVVPLAQRPELQKGGKGYLYITALHNPDDPTSTSSLGVFPKALKITDLAPSLRNTTLTDFVVWNPELVDLQPTKFARKSNAAKVYAESRRDYLSKRGYNDISLHTYPDRFVQIAVRRPAKPHSSAEAVFPLSTNFQPDLGERARKRLEQLRRFAKRVGCMD